MEPIIEITSPTDTIVMTGTDIGGGWIYDNDSLDAWLALAEVDVKLNKRPNAHGTYLPDQLFTGEHRTSITGKYFGASALDAAQARNRLSALFNDGKAVMITVTDALGPTSRTGLVIDVDPEWMPDANFTFSLVIASPDPRRYGTLREGATGLPSASSGLVWPLGSGSKFWDWGSAGDVGRVAVANDGNTTTFPVMLIGAGGDLPGGFFITEVETGREITFAGATGGGEVRIDNRTRRITINGGDVTGEATRKEWFAVPPETAYTYQFGTLGAVVGDPQLKALGADAYL